MGGVVGSVFAGFWWGFWWVVLALGNLRSKETEVFKEKWEDKNMFLFSGVY